MDFDNEEDRQMFNLAFGESYNIRRMNPDLIWKMRDVVQKYNNLKRMMNYTERKAVNGY